MDIKIENKDIALSKNGHPVRLEGIDEYLQHALVSLSAKRGCFCYNREFGAFKALKEIENPSELLKEAEAALSNQPELTVKSAAKEGNEAVFIIDTPFGEGEIRL